LGRPVPRRPAGRHGLPLAGAGRRGRSGKSLSGFSGKHTTKGPEGPFRLRGSGRLRLAFDLRGPSVAAEPADKIRRAADMDVRRRARRRGVFLCARFLCTSKGVARALSARNALDPALPLCASSASPDGRWKQNSKNKDKRTTASALTRGSLLSWQK